MKAKRGYEGLTHTERAAFSGYLQGLRLEAGLSQGGLADQADGKIAEVDAKAVQYFEGHPAEPLSHRRRRDQLGAICCALAEWLGRDRGALALEVNRLAGGVALPEREE